MPSPTVTIDEDPSFYERNFCFTMSYGRHQGDDDYFDYPLGDEEEEIEEEKDEDEDGKDGDATINETMPEDEDATMDDSLPEDSVSVAQDETLDNDGTQDSEHPDSEPQTPVTDDEDPAWDTDTDEDESIPDVESIPDIDDPDATRGPYHKQDLRWMLASKQILSEAIEQCTKPRGTKSVCLSFKTKRGILPHVSLYFSETS